MSPHDIVQIAFLVVGSIGSGGLIVVGLSSWLGKVRANRLMEQERHKHNEELERLRDSLRLASEQELASLKSQLELSKEIKVREQLDCVMIYRAAIDMVTAIIAKIEMMTHGKRGPLSNDEYTISRFNDSESMLTWRCMRRQPGRRFEGLVLNCKRSSSGHWNQGGAD